jgi:hypothetical protein
MSPQEAGYSGTVLAKKLGIAEGCRVLVKGAPDDYVQLLAPIPAGVLFVKNVSRLVDVIHLFNDKRARLKVELEGLRKTIRPDAVVWVSWPKKASKVPTDITDETIRELALPLGFVDVKICAINEVWSGLKLVIRKELR